MSNPHTKQFTDENFAAEVLSSETPVLVDFWAPWCGPCRAIAPAVDEIAAEYEGRVKVGKMNVDENHEVPTRCRIQSIPALVVFRGGKMVDQVVGARPKAYLDAVLRRHLEDTTDAA